MHPTSVVAVTRSICWFRRDLRLTDNPAWSAATEADEVLALYVLEPALLARAGDRRRAHLLAAVADLGDQLAQLGGRLLVVEGPAHAVVASLAAEHGVAEVHANADVTPFARIRDAHCDGVAPMRWHWGTLVQPPGAVLTGKGTLSRVFTPFYRRWAQTEVGTVQPAGSARLLDPVGGIPLPEADPSIDPTTAGSRGAQDRLAAFCGIVDDYPDLRDLPAVAGTSSLSADLRFGTLGPREVLYEVGGASPGREAFCRQLAWRDWYAHLFHQNPALATRAMKPEYDAIAWRDDPADLEAWQQGLTGYPMVDAGMRQLLHTGWMHNRVRMITASFLVKDLLIDWRSGEHWFRTMLIDADVPQNVGNWQWVAGTGPDAAPYFRVLNPVTQSRRFDPDGEYIRRWVPELAELSNSVIHEPWTAAPLDLAAAGVVLGDTYPAPLVDHGDARDRTLDAYKSALGRT